MLLFLSQLLTVRQSSQNALSRSFRTDYKISQKKFPHSNILTSIPFELDNIEDFLKRLNKVTGFTERKTAMVPKMRKSIKKQ